MLFIGYVLVEFGALQTYYIAEFQWIDSKGAFLNAITNSICHFGGIVGALTVYFTATLFGSKNSILMADCCVIAGSALVYILLDINKAHSMLDSRKAVERIWRWNIICSLPNVHK